MPHSDVPSPRDPATSARGRAGDALPAGGRRRHGSTTGGSAAVAEVRVVGHHGCRDVAVNSGGSRAEAFVQAVDASPVRYSSHEVAAATEAEAEDITTVSPVVSVAQLSR